MYKKIKKMQQCLICFNNSSNFEEIIPCKHSSVCKNCLVAITFCPECNNPICKNLKFQQISTKEDPRVFQVDTNDSPDSIAKVMRFVFNIDQETPIQFMYKGKILDKDFKFKNINADADASIYIIEKYTGKLY